MTHLFVSEMNVLYELEMRKELEMKEKFSFTIDQFAGNEPIGNETVSGNEPEMNAGNEPEMNAGNEQTD